MSDVVIVTDSTAGIPEPVRGQLPITVIPLHLLWGKDDLRDGVDITPKAFYERLERDPQLPHTSQVPPEEFKQVYSRLLDEGKDVLSIQISSKVSATYSSAMVAQEEIGSEHVEVLDSQSSSMGMGFAVLAAARAAQAGQSLEEVKQTAQQALDNSGILFVVRTLDYLAKGGRIGGAAALLGSLLQIKPVLTAKDGLVEVAAQVRTWSKSLDRLVDLVQQRVIGKKPIHLAVLHANAETEAHGLLDKVEHLVGMDRVCEVITSHITPVLGTHFGPGTLAIAYMVGP
jgi:DegV family protein with EDD domain